MVPKTIVILALQLRLVLSFQYKIELNQFSSENKQKSADHMESKYNNSVILQFIFSTTPKIMQISS